MGKEKGKSRLSRHKPRLLKQETKRKFFSHLHAVLRLTSSGLPCTAHTAPYTKDIHNTASTTSSVTNSTSELVMSTEENGVVGSTVSSTTTTTQTPSPPPPSVLTVPITQAEPIDCDSLLASLQQSLSRTFSSQRLATVATQYAMQSSTSPRSPSTQSSLTPPPSTTSTNSTQAATKQVRVPPGRFLSIPSMSQAAALKRKPHTRKHMAPSAPAPFLQGEKIALVGFGQGKMGQLLRAKLRQAHAEETSPSAAHILIIDSNVTLTMLNSLVPTRGNHVMLCTANWLGDCILQQQKLSCERYAWVPNASKARASPPPPSSPASTFYPCSPLRSRVLAPAPNSIPPIEFSRSLASSPASPSRRSSSPTPPPIRDEEKSIDTKERPQSPVRTPRKTTKIMTSAVFGPAAIDGKRERFACQRSGTSQMHNLNKHITDHIEPLIDIYKAVGDEWRVYAYTKAVGVLRSFSKRISSVEDLNSKKLHGIGHAIKQKIRFILENGYLNRTLEMQQDPRIQSLMQMAKVFGIGTARAKDFFAKGFRSPQELRERGWHLLTAKQQIGVTHFEDFQKRIPRDEVTHIFNRIKNALIDVVGQAEFESKRIEVVCCGSYRRGADTCGDCDVLISHPSPTYAMFDQLLEKLHSSTGPFSLLTDDLSRPDDSKTHNSLTYMGAGRIHSGTPFRRIDIKIYPTSMFAFALLYFTGSDYFNRSMRNFAKRKELTLSDHGLAPCTRVNGSKVSSGESIVCFTEREIFDALGLEYREPIQRNCYLREGMASYANMPPSPDRDDDLLVLD